MDATITFPFQNFAQEVSANALLGAGGCACQTSVCSALSPRHSPVLVGTWPACLGELGQALLPVTVPTISRAVPVSCSDLSQWDLSQLCWKECITPGHETRHGPTMVLKFSQSKSFKIISTYYEESSVANHHMCRYFISLSSTISFLLFLSFHYSTAFPEL